MGCGKLSTAAAQIAASAQSRVAGHVHWQLLEKAVGTRSARISIDSSSRRSFRSRTCQPWGKSSRPHTGYSRSSACANDRLDYERTLKEWYFKLRARRQEALAHVGADAVVRYERYLSLFAVGFHTRAMNLCRIVLRPVGRH